MNETCFVPANILLPADADMAKWSVVACDQYTSQPEYWQEVDRFVGQSPSTLRLTLPEVYLEEPNVDMRIAGINAAMERYLTQGVFKTLPHCYLYIERTLSDGAVRRGLMGAVDLEAYDYRKGSRSAVRATESTVLERIPPRVKVREHAALELPHVMLLLDDEQDTVLSPLAQKAAAGSLQKCYDFGLMQGGGHICGYLCGPEEAAQIKASLAAFADPAHFAKKYGAPEDEALVLAVGDGNHSLATAKACYEKIKETLGEKALSHPARYALAEAVNLHDDALQFEPIHRVLFGVEPGALLTALRARFETCEGEQPDGQSFRYVWQNALGALTVKHSPCRLAVGTLQEFLDGYLKENGGRIDYVHGDETAAELGAKPGNMAFLLPCMPKSELFRTVIAEGALPRKTFSMGHAQDKRFYLECRKLRKE